MKDRKAERAAGLVSIWTGDFLFFGIKVPVFTQGTADRTSKETFLSFHSRSATDLHVADLFDLI